jgi:uncharacterized protein YceK
MRLALVAAVLLLSGCGTLMTQTPAFARQFKKVKCGDDAPHYLPRMYSGTALDVWSVIANPPGQIGVWLAFDVPVSLVGDTLLLPYTTIRQIGSGSYRCVPKE